MDADGNRVEVNDTEKRRCIRSTAGTAEAQPEQPQSAPVQTGDSTPVTWLFALLALSGTGIVGSKAKKKSKSDGIKKNNPAGTVGR